MPRVSLQGSLPPKQDNDFGMADLLEIQPCLKLCFQVTLGLILSSL